MHPEKMFYQVVSGVIALSLVVIAKEFCQANQTAQKTLMGCNTMANNLGKGMVKASAGILDMGNALQGGLSVSLSRPAVARGRLLELTVPTASMIHSPDLYTLVLTDLH